MRAARFSNARLYDDSQAALAAMREQRRLDGRILADITTELTMQRDVDDLLDYILGRMSGFFAGAAVTVMLIQGGEAEVVRTTSGEKALLGMRLDHRGDSHASRWLDTQRPFLIDDTLADASEWIRTDAPRGSGPI